MRAVQAAATTSGALDMSSTSAAGSASILSDLSTSDPSQRTESSKSTRQTVVIIDGNADLHTSAIGVLSSAAFTAQPTTSVASSTVAGLSTTVSHGHRARTTADDGNALSLSSNPVAEATMVNGAAQSTMPPQHDGEVLARAGSPITSVPLTLISHGPAPMVSLPDVQSDENPPSTIALEEPAKLIDSIDDFLTDQRR